MDRSSLPNRLLSFAAAALLLTACTGPGSFAPTETAIAARVMTQIAQTPCACVPEAAPTPGILSGPQLIDTRILQESSPAEQACLLQALGEGSYRELAGLQRPPTDPEVTAIVGCLGKAALSATARPSAPTAFPAFPTAVPALPPAINSTPAPQFPPGVTPGAGSLPGTTVGPQAPPGVIPATRPPAGPTAIPTATPTLGAGAALGPRYHQVMLASSSDGLGWAPEGIPVRLQASSPAIVSLSNGSVYLIMHDGLTNDFSAQRRQPGAIAWEGVRLVLRGRTGLPSTDPELVLLPDGRLRLFYAGPSKPFDPLAPEVIYSAISTDGITYDQEAGVRFGGDLIAEPSAVILPEGGWLMAVTQGSRVLLASSTDGNIFTATGIEIVHGTSPELAVNPDGSLRIYLNAGNAVISLTSTDRGTTWQPDNGLRLQPSGNIAAEPSVTRLPDGNWLMAWRRYDPLSIRTP